METPRIPYGMCPAVSPYSFGSPGGAVRTDIDGGVGRYGLMYDRGTQQFQVTLVLSGAYFTVWNAFFLRVIDKGVISFIMTMDSGMGLEDHLCNIIPGSYGATLTSGTMYSVSFVIEAEAASTYDLSDSQIADLIDIHNVTEGKTHALFDRLAQFANFDTNVLNF